MPLPSRIMRISRILFSLPVAKMMVFSSKARSKMLGKQMEISKSILENNKENFKDLARVGAEMQKEILTENEDVLKEGVNRLSFYKNYDSEYDKPIEIPTKIKRIPEYMNLLKDKCYGEVIADDPMSLRNYLRESCSGFIKNDKLEHNTKLDWLKDFLEIDNSRIVIFVNYNMEVKMISELCDKLKRPYSIYNGEFKDFTNFKNNSNGIAIVNYASGATGINDLCISNIGIFYSLPDGDYILFKQAKARLDRIGQSKQPIFYYLLMEGTIESPIYRAFKNGDNFTNQMYLNWLEKVNKGGEK